MFLIWRISGSEQSRGLAENEAGKHGLPSGSPPVNGLPCRLSISCSIVCFVAKLGRRVVVIRATDH